jgi:hypothetical protein
MLVQAIRNSHGVAKLDSATKAPTGRILRAEADDWQIGNKLGRSRDHDGLDHSGDGAGVCERITVVG